MPRIVKPKYVDPVEFGGGVQLGFRPPFLFREVSARVFPLKANIARLAQLVDEYLNMDIPDEIVHFTPALPYVYLMALNYGGMSVSTLDALRMGWVAQHETFFYIPLQRWRREHGKLEFKGWTGVSPFMFVDDPASMTIGREVYGWAKAYSALDASRPTWSTHPRAPERLLTLSTPMFGKTFAGEREPMRVLLTIDRAPAASLAEYPLDPLSPLFAPNALADLWRSSLSMAQEALDLVAQLRVRGYPNVAGPDALLAMARDGLGLIGDVAQGLWSPPSSGSASSARATLIEDLPRYFSSTITLKQFRDPANAERACYSALVDSKMGVDRINQLGMLGEANWLRGDTSGGYSIGLHRYQAEPIVDTLGLEVPPGAENPREGDVLRLAPSYPFWMDFDLYYGPGEVVCSRIPAVAGGDWIEEARSGAERHGHRRDRKPRPTASACGYNTSLGAATLPVTGPLHFPDMTIEVFPLLADPAKLKDFLQWYWNRLFEGGQGPAKLRLEPMGSHVYLTVSIVGDAYGRMWSSSENIGWWADHEVAFVIPVRWYENGKLIGVAMIEPLLLADKARAVATDREVIGRNSFLAAIDSPPDVWTSPGGPRAPRRLTRVRAESFIEPGYGLPATTGVLMQIDERAPIGENEPAAWREIADDWGRRLAQELHRKSRAWAEQRGAIEDVQALGLEALVHGAPINRLTLKQHRDAAEFDRACYQAVVHSERRIERVHEIGEIKTPPHIALHRLPSWPIVATLGLEIKHVRSDGAVVEYLEPVRPFWLRVAVTDGLGRVVATVDPNLAAVDPHLAPVGVADPPRAWSFEPPPVAPRGFEGAGRMRVGAHVVAALRCDGAGELKAAVALQTRRALTKEICWLQRAPGTAPLAADLPAYLAALPIARLAAAADDLLDRLAGALPPLPPLPRVPVLQRLARFAAAPDALAAITDADTRRRGEALLAAFAEPERETDASLRAASAAELYDLAVALLRGGTSDTRPQEAAGHEAAPRSPLLALVVQVEAWVVAPELPEAAREALGWLKRARFVAEYGFDAERLALLDQAFDLGARGQLERLARAGDGFADMQRAYHDAKTRGRAAPPDPTAALRFVAKALERDVADWLAPQRFLRMTHSEAKVALERLEDLQLVFEAILDDGWQSAAGPRRAPRARMPTASVGPFGRPETTWGAEHGLTRLNDDEFVVAGDEHSAGAP